LIIYVKTLFPNSHMWKLGFAISLGGDTIHPAYIFIHTYTQTLYVQKKSMVIFTYVLTIYLSWICPLHHSPSFHSPTLRTISTGFILLFLHMNTKYIHHIHPHSSFPCAHPSPTSTHPRKDLFYLPVHHFLKCVLLVQGE
jgi:hypothetical protein